MRPLQESAPAPGGQRGAKAGTPNDTPLTPRPILDRPFPADTYTLFGMGALTWPRARERFMELGLPPLAFMDDDARALAAMLLADRDPTAAELAILGRDDGERVPWIMALEMHHPTDAEWAVHSVERFAVLYARRWLPPVLRWAAERMEAGAWTLAHAAGEIDAMLTLARPAVVEGRAA